MLKYNNLKWLKLQKNIKILLHSVFFQKLTFYPEILQDLSDLPMMIIIN
jgi:hypothetical protein